MDYIDKTILRLRREYSKDEIVSALNKQISERDVTIGILKDTIDELRERIQDIHKGFDKEALIEGRMKRLENQLIKQEKDKNKSLKAQIKLLKKEKDQLLTKLLKATS